MRIAAIALLALLAGGAWAPAPAHADPYQWCGIYGGGGDAATNCYFRTIDQCRAAMFGNGGFCTPNQFYDGRPVGASGEPMRGRRAPRG